MAAAPASAHQSSTAATSSSVRGSATTSGGWRNSRPNARTTSRNDFPYVCPARSPASAVPRGARASGGGGRPGVGWWREPGCGELQLLDRRRFRDGELVEVEHPGQRLGHLLLLVPGRALALVSPAPELPPPGRHGGRVDRLTKPEACSILRT